MIDLRQRILDKAAQLPEILTAVAATARLTTIALFDLSPDSGCMLALGGASPPSREYLGAALPAMVNGPEIRAVLDVFGADAGLDDLTFDAFRHPDDPRRMHHHLARLRLGGDHRFALLYVCPASSAGQLLLARQVAERELARVLQLQTR